MRTISAAIRSPSGMKLLGLAVAGLMLLVQLHCDPVSGDAGIPEISNISSLNPVYVAYTSPDRIERPDTVTFSFKYTSSVKGPVEVRLTLDSGTTWHSIGNVAPEGNLTETFSWVPGNADSTVIGYFGKKQAVIELFDRSSETTADSDPFVLIGTLPVLVQPLALTTIDSGDTIHVRYVQNVDISGYFTVLFKSDEMTDWVTVTTGTDQVLRDLPLRYYETKIVPADFLEDVNEKDGNDFAQPIRVLVADYQQNEGALIYTDYITVTLQ